MCVLCVRVCASVQEVENLYADALDSHAHSALLHLFVVQHMQVYRGNPHIELLHLTAAEVTAKCTSSNE